MSSNPKAAVIQQYVEQYHMADFLNAQLLQYLRWFHFPVDTHIFSEQSEQHRLYFLVDGKVQCSHYHTTGKIAIFAISTPFTVIGDMEIMSEQPIYSNVIAMRPTTMLGIERQIVHRYGADDARFLRFLNDQLREKIYALNALKKHAALPLRQRLMAYIASQTITEDNHVILPAKEDLAAILGSTPRHLNRVLRELVNKEYISDSYPLVHILNRAALVNFNK